MLETIPSISPRLLLRPYPTIGFLTGCDNSTSPSTSARRQAELFLNFIVCPEIIGQMVNENCCAMPDDAARPNIFLR